jgi:hypothetical protein
MIDEKWLSEFRPVARGVASAEYLDSLTDKGLLSLAESMGIGDFEHEFRTTWFLRYDDAERDAGEVVPDGEQAYVEVGVARIEDLQNVNEREGLVTIEDGLVDIRQLIPVGA